MNPVVGLATSLALALPRHLSRSTSTPSPSISPVLLPEPGQTRALVDLISLIAGPHRHVTVRFPSQKT